ncbi:tyrosine-type recombinase/integrase [Halostreptopolyspora alba]|uniref:tyrosine-type recombinase/integrase n=1 Tax=Halostreptopolyspora alba TaxID=2487137 RepID=UPI002698B2B4
MARTNRGPAPPRHRRPHHIAAQWFRNHIWRPALAASGLERRVRFHDLRHAHASWVLAGGADLQVVKERLGHSDIATTARYLHTLPDADETALEALSKVRSRAPDSADDTSGPGW